jgi:hypothetical protein
VIGAKRRAALAQEEAALRVEVVRRPRAGLGFDMLDVARKLDQSAASSTLTGFFTAGHAATVCWKSALRAGMVRLDTKRAG